MIKNPKTNEREVKEAKDLPNPNEFEDFKNKIAKIFQIKNKKRISLISITQDEDEYPINSQEDLKEYKDDIKKFEFYIEDEDIGSSDKKKEESHSFDEEKKDEKSEGEKEDQKSEEEDEGNQDFKIKLDVNLDITDKEMENIIDSQIKEVPEEKNENINDDIEFDINKYTQNLNIKFKNKTDEFIKLFNSKIDEIVTQKSELIKNKVNNLILEFSNINKNNLNNMNEETKNIVEDFKDLSENTNVMSKAMGDLKGALSKIDMIVMKFEKPVIELEESIKKAKYFNIENIKIENLGDKSFNSLYLVKDNNNSSKEFIFFGNTKNSSECKLSLNGDFEPKKKESYTVSVNINDPKPDQEYTLLLYVREKPDGNNLSKPLKIIVKLKPEEEDPQKKKEKEAINLYQELESKYNLSTFNKQEVINKIIEINCDKDLFDKWIKTKIEENKQKEYEKLFEELDKEFNFTNLNIDKEEVINKIKEEQLNKEKIKDWINNKKEEIQNNKIENLYAELDKEYKFSESNIKKEEVINKIKEENFDKEKIKEWIKAKLPQPDPDIKPEVQKLFDELDDEYTLSTILDKDEVIKKIIEYNCDREKINKWIEDSM